MNSAKFANCCGGCVCGSQREYPQRLVAIENGKVRQLVVDTWQRADTDESDNHAFIHGEYYLDLNSTIKKFKNCQFCMKKTPSQAFIVTSIAWVLGNALQISIASQCQCKVKQNVIPYVWYDTNNYKKFEQTQAKLKTK